MNKKDIYVVWGVVIAIMAVGILLQVSKIQKDSLVGKEIRQRCGKKAFLVKETGQITCSKNVKKAFHRDRKKRIDNTLTTIQLCGRSVTAVKPAIEALKRANKAFVRAAQDKGKTGSKWKCIQVGLSFRTNAHQKRLYDAAWTCKDATTGKTTRCKKRKFVVAKPGHSFHEAGRAFDINNWLEAGPYLKKEGFCGGWAGLYCDPWHYSWKNGDECRNKSMSQARYNWLCISGNKAKKLGQVAKKAGKGAASVAKKIFRFFFK